MKKATRATLKSFVNKNRDQLKIRNNSNFDGMVDCVMPSDDPAWRDATATEKNVSYTYGVEGMWLVLGGRDWIERADFGNGLEGFHVWNCCGSFDVAVRA